MGSNPDPLLHYQSAYFCRLRGVDLVAWAVCRGWESQIPTVYAYYFVGACDKLWHFSCACSWAWWNVCRFVESGNLSRHQKYFARWKQRGTNNVVCQSIVLLHNLSTFKISQVLSDGFVCSTCIRLKYVNLFLPLILISRNLISEISLRTPSYAS